MSAAVRLALGLLTVVPVGAPPVRRRAAGGAMLAAPLVGVLLGGLVLAVAGVVRVAGGAPLLVAVAGVATLAALTRGLHLDGLADTADGLGCGRPAPAALEVMRRSDVGPFGVVTLVLGLLAQVAAAAQLVAAGLGPAAVLAVPAARAALPLACRHGIPAARADGLGVLVAATVRPVAAWLVAAGTTAAVAGLGGLAGAPWWAGGAAAAVALLVAEGLRRRCTRRLGGITGDVLGALVVTAETGFLVALALASAH